eukprot:1160182-Pelagomonas_calceolata.AAC.1
MSLHRLPSKTRQACITTTQARITFCPEFVPLVDRGCLCSGAVAGPIQDGVLAHMFPARAAGAISQLQSSSVPEAEATTAQNHRGYHSFTHALTQQSGNTH